MFEALFVLQLLTFLTWLFGYAEKRFHEKMMVKLTLQAGKNSFNTHIVQYLIKGNQTMKFNRPVECNMRNNIREKSYTEYDRDVSPRLNRRITFSTSLSQQS